MSEFINPYNFIPLKGSPKRENRRESDNQEKFTGVIEYSVLSKTRMFIPIQVIVKCFNLIYQ